MTTTDRLAPLVAGVLIVAVIAVPLVYAVVQFRAFVDGLAL